MMFVAHTAKGIISSYQLHYHPRILIISTVYYILHMFPWYVSKSSYVFLTNFGQLPVSLSQENRHSCPGSTCLTWSDLHFH